MLKKIPFSLSIAFLIMPMLSFSLITPVFAVAGNPNADPNSPNSAVNNTLDLWGAGSEDVNEDTIRSATGLGVEDPRTIAANVINVILGFLGIIAVVLILYGGFLWMTAAGNDDKVGQAKQLMTAGVIGLVIILAAFGIARFVINALLGATGGN